MSGRPGPALAIALSKRLRASICAPVQPWRRQRQQQCRETFSASWNAGVIGTYDRW